eukprot:TRINITY_DN6778_c0_g2_i1.p1 TRINITY_DN6778_c0_g2~~TRINITY_DN6778_c0_g2_i1.p1  ORF type:complete len:119 (+),score=16.51 TRINITY_DN6778_c0_g2_i1:66-422(+)
MCIRDSSKTARNETASVFLLSDEPLHEEPGRYEAMYEKVLFEYVLQQHLGEAYGEWLSKEVLKPAYQKAKKMSWDWHVRRQTRDLWNISLLGALVICSCVGAWYLLRRHRRMTKDHDM